MSDVIKDAKQLLDTATPGEWQAADSDIIAEDNGLIATVSEYSGLDEISEEYANVQLIAAAPELAQALAEETWEYSAQAKRGDYWETCINPETHLEEWWPDKDGAEWAASRLQEQGRETRIVRRRVSPPEVITNQEEEK